MGKIPHTKQVVKAKKVKCASKQTVDVEWRKSDNGSKFLVYHDEKFLTGRKFSTDYGPTDVDFDEFVTQIQKYSF